MTRRLHLAPWIAVALAAATLALLPAVAAAHVVTRSSDGVTATLSWKHNYEGTKHFRIAIDRGGSRVLDERVRSDVCSNVAGYACPWPPLSHQLELHDLDGDGEPEAVVAGYTGGAHCCLLAIVYRWDGDSYERTERNFGNPGWRLKDLEDDGTFEFLTYDDRFEYLYGSYAGSVPPIQVFGFVGNGDFADVTDTFRALVREDARRAGREYRRRAQSRRQLEVRAALAGYVADLYRLGRDHDAKHALISALDRGLLDRQAQFDVGPFGRAFIRDLKHHLRDWGYR